MGELRETLRSNIEKYINASNLTQKEIAERLGVSKSSVTNWIKGKNSPDVELLDPLCTLLGVSFTQLYGMEDHTPSISLAITGKKEASPPNDELAPLLQKPLMKEIYDAALQLSPENRKIILAQIEAVRTLEEDAKK